MVPEVWSEASYGCPDGFDKQARWRGTAETGAHERQRAGIAEAETHGRTVDFHLPHTGESRACHPNRSPALECSYVSTLIKEKTLNQRLCSLFFKIFLLLLFFLLSHLCGCRYWCEPEERFFPLAARDGGARRQEDTTFTLMWEDYLPPTRGAQMRGKCCALTAEADKATAPWPARGDEKHRRWQPREPPASVDTAAAPAARAPRLFPFLGECACSVLCTQHQKFAYCPAQPVVLRTSGYVSFWVFYVNLVGAVNWGGSACVLLVLLGHLGFFCGHAVCGEIWSNDV